jgi:hypothetical protein
VETEPLIFESLLNPVHPRHLVDALREFRIVGAVNLNAGPAFLLCAIAGNVGPAQRLFDGGAGLGYARNADAGRYRK